MEPFYSMEIKINGRTFVIEEEFHEDFLVSLKKMLTQKVIDSHAKAEKALDQTVKHIYE